jgi:hypothetical protein
MAKLSSAAWVAHDLGLAASLGGTLFGRVALQPALYKVALPEERDLVSADAWRRFSLINLLGHAAFASTWFIGRSMLTGREVSAKARTLVHVKDALVIASLVTGIGSVIAGNLLGQRGKQGRGPQAVKEGERFGHSEETVARTRTIKRTVGSLGALNMLATMGVGAVTAMLAMESGKSGRFSAVSRFLP